MPHERWMPLPKTCDHVRSVAGVLPIIAAASPILTNVRSIFDRFEGTVDSC